MDDKNLSPCGFGIYRNFQTGERFEKLASDEYRKIDDDIDVVTQDLLRDKEKGKVNP